MYPTSVCVRYAGTPGIPLKMSEPVPDVATVVCTFHRLVHCMCANYKHLVVMFLCKVHGVTSTAKVTVILRTSQQTLTPTRVVLRTHAYMTDFQRWVPGSFRFWSQCKHSVFAINMIIHQLSVPVFLFSATQSFRNCIHWRQIIQNLQGS